MAYDLCNSTIDFHSNLPYLACRQLHIKPGGFTNTVKVRHDTVTQY